MMTIPTEYTGDPSISPDDLFNLPDEFWGESNNFSRFEAAASRARLAELEPCTVCGKPVRNGWVVIVVNGGESAVRNDVPYDIGDPGFMGCHFIGPECGRMIPAKFRKKM